MIMFQYEGKNVAATNDKIDSIAIVSGRAEDVPAFIALTDMTLQSVAPYSTQSDRDSVVTFLLREFYLRGLGDNDYLQITFYDKYPLRFYYNGGISMFTIELP